MEYTMVKKKLLQPYTVRTVHTHRIVFSYAPYSVFAFPDLEPRYCFRRHFVSCITSLSLFPLQLALPLQHASHIETNHYYLSRQAYHFTSQRHNINIRFCIRYLRACCLLFCRAVSLLIKSVEYQLLLSVYADVKDC